MAKVKSLAVRGSVGKLGGMVYYNTNGVSLQREEAASVANPNTGAQVNTRSRFKLMSQLSASMKREIAIHRKGLQSSRNRFVETNFDLVSYEDGAATINLNKVQLTDSRRPLGTLSVDRSCGTAIQCSVAVKPAIYEKVVVCAYRKSDDEKLEYVGSSIADVDASGTTVLSLPYTSDAVVTYAYGIAYSSAAAHAKYGNLEADPAQQVASLVQSSSATAGAARFSKTIGCTMGLGETSATTYVYNFAIGSVNGVGDGPAALKLTGNSVVVSNDIPSGSNVTIQGYYYQGQGAEIYHFDGSNVSFNGKTITFSTTGIAGKFIEEISVTIDDLTKTKNLPNQLPTASCNFSVPADTSTFNEGSITFSPQITLSDFASKTTIIFRDGSQNVPTQGVLDGSFVTFTPQGYEDGVQCRMVEGEIKMEITGLALPSYINGIEIEGYDVVYQS